MDKKRQHYVWKHYLKPWTMDEKIWWSRNGKIMPPTALVNVGIRKHFYEIEKLNGTERFFVKKFIEGCHPTVTSGLFLCHFHRNKRYQ